MRITEGENIFDRTDIHPESYKIAENLLTKLNLTKEDIGTPKIVQTLESVDVSLLAQDLNSDEYTIADIIKSLQKPNRDPRDDMPKPLLKSDILEIKDLKIGMKLQGTVRNVIDFGAFVDIGLHNDGLVHISKMTDKYIKHPSEVVSVGDIVDCYVIDINAEKEKVSLSLLEPNA